MDQFGNSKDLQWNQVLLSLEARLPIAQIQLDFPSLVFQP